MDLFRSIIDLFLHLDDHLSQVISQYGVWTNLILFLIVFAETGLVVTPFLPGDSLLFAAGNRAVLVRARPDGGEDVYKLRLEDLLDEADLTANAPVLPGDVIMVPEGLL